MKPTRKIAIAGLGAAAVSIHLPVYRGIDSLNLVGGCDPNLAEVAQHFPFPVYPDLKTLIINTRPDILTVASPTSEHFDLVRTGLEAGCHIFCEKPFTSTVDEARQLIRLSQEARRWIVVNNEFRFMNIYQSARDRIGTEDFGELLFLSANQTFFVTDSTEAGWRGKDPQRTCKEFGIHVLDLCRYFFAEEPLYISAKMHGREGASRPDYLNLLQLEFSGHRFAHITLDRLSRGPHRYLDLRLDGSKGVIETEIGGRLEFRAGIRSGDRKPFMGMDFSPGGSASLYRGERRKKMVSDPLNVFAHATRKLITAYLEALENGTVPPGNAQDNIKTLALMLAAYESDCSGHPVMFAEKWADTG